MSVMVYSRLSDLLRTNNLTVRDLQQQIADRFGLAVGTRALERLARAGRVRRTDLEVVAAVAETLGVGLNEMFAVETAPVSADLENEGEREMDIPDVEEHDVLDPEQSRRLQSLYNRQHRRSLTDAEWAEMDELVAAWGRGVYERGVRDIAAQRGQPVEQVRAELAAERDRILTWRRELDADPARLRALIDEARERRQARVRASG